jgi:hypothetical protein
VSLLSQLKQLDPNNFPVNFPALHNGWRYCLTLTDEECSALYNQLTVIGRSDTGTLANGATKHRPFQWSFNHASSCHRVWWVMLASEYQNQPIPRYRLNANLAQIPETGERF